MVRDSPEALVDTVAGGLARLDRALGAEKALEKSVIIIITITRPEKQEGGGWGPKKGFGKGEEMNLGPTECGRGQGLQSQVSERQQGVLRRVRPGVRHQGVVGIMAKWKAGPFHGTRL